MIIKRESVSIILNQYKNGNITEDEALTLLDDLCSNNVVYNPPSYPWTTYPWITYDTKQPEIQKFEVTCKNP